MRADCHCHSNHSDGTLSVSALLDLAKARNLTGLSITDHDSFAGYEEALPYAKTLDIQLISGIEISAHIERASIHVLGYAFDLKNTALNQFCQQLNENRKVRNLEICERLNRYDISISMEAVQQRFPNCTLGRPHIAFLMVEKGYVKSIQQAFKRYLGEGAKCAVPDLGTDVPTAIGLIQQAGGFAVLAHPHYIKNKRILPPLLDMPFDGIEAYYGNLGPKQEQPWVDLANKKNWLITGGSDFHGEKKSFHGLGCSFTPNETFEIFVSRFENHT
jgi:predicted metal-dependent phosphoesterase TrpH